MILLVILAASLLLALARGGRFENLQYWQPRWGFLAGLALIVQIGLVFLQPESHYLIVALLVASLASLAVFVVANRKLPGMVLLSIGLALNVIVVIANGGFMPVSPGALDRAGLQALAGLPEGTLLEGSKDVLLQSEHARLWWLGDIIPLPAPISVVLSIGDLAVAAGGAWYLQKAMFSLRSRSASEVRRVAAP